jgi:hypothetical protein
MNKKTLKSLIDIEFERFESKEKFKEEVFRLIDLYEMDNSNSFNPLPINVHLGSIGSEIPVEVPYGDLCSCNPKNGGSGICGCVMGNKMVTNPKATSSNTTSNFIGNYLYTQK